MTFGGRGPAWPPIVDELVAAWGSRLPAAYVSLLMRCNGGEGTLPVHPHRAILWPADEVLQLNDHFDVGHAYPGLLGIGGDGGANLIAFDTRPPHPWRVVAVPYVGVEQEMREIAPDFTTFRALLGFGAGEEKSDN
ncbi:MAG: SMI1/KNR4 family protein [Vicinamibacteria bacterium]|nr:SMI1/KNR4 family protein [Vicinamibacteria bacterium]